MGPHESARSSPGRGHGKRAAGGCEAAAAAGELPSGSRPVESEVGRAGAVR
ncbi:MAG: hypothetical protein ACUVRM_10260 [Bacillota bacterium]